MQKCNPASGFICAEKNNKEKTNSFKECMVMMDLYMEWISQTIKKYY